MLLILGLMPVVASTSFAQESSFKVIVNAGSDVDAISTSDLSRIFLKNIRKWDGSNLTIEPVDLLPNSRVRADFSDKVHGKSVSSIKAQWSKRIFSGKGVPPAELENDSAVVDYVKSTPGAIGYVSSNARTTDVKVLTVK